MEAVLPRVRTSPRVAVSDTSAVTASDRTPSASSGSDRARLTLLHICNTPSTPPHPAGDPARGTPRGPLDRPEGEEEVRRTYLVARLSRLAMGPLRGRSYRFPLSAGPLPGGYWWQPSDVVEVVHLALYFGLGDALFWVPRGGAPRACYGRQRLPSGLSPDDWTEVA